MVMVFLLHNQVGRYYTSQKYNNHWDAFDLNTEDGRRFAQNGGQRVCTVLVYLNDVASGGCTAFPQLGMKVHPKKGQSGRWRLWYCIVLVLVGNAPSAQGYWDVDKTEHS